jgi:hypothetical protein
LALAQVSRRLVSHLFSLITLSPVLENGLIICRLYPGISERRQVFLFSYQVRL